MKTSQSLIKDIIPEDFCPHYIHLKYKVGVKTEPSEAMENGLFFESELLGSARDGKYELPRKKNGEPYKRELDILENVQYAKNIFKELEIKIEEVQPKKEKNNRSGSIDAIGTIKNEKAIFDVKWTGMAQDKYKRELRYSLLNDFEIQARHYQSLNLPLDFYFLIFGKSNWCEIVRFKYDEDEVIRHIEEVSEIAEYKFENLNEYEFNPDYEKCSKCRLKEICKKKIKTPMIREYTDYRN